MERVDMCDLEERAPQVKTQDQDQKRGKNFKMSKNTRIKRQLEWELINAIKQLKESKS